MSYAVRKDGLGWRAVTGPDDVTKDEMYSPDLPVSKVTGLTHEQVQHLRLLAYSDPITGSDKFFAEATRVRAMGGTEDDIRLILKAGADRFSEIQEQYPWPK